MVSVILADLTIDEARLRLTQQRLVAEFGLFALGIGPLQRLLDEACRVSAVGLQTEMAKVLQHRPAIKDLLVAAGLGWHAGVVGYSTLGSGLDSPAGYALHTGQPTLSNHLAQERRFHVPSVLAEHGVQSAINVVIGLPAQSPYGVLEVDSTRRHEFVGADTAFLQSLANVLAAGIARIEIEEAKDALLRDNDLLMREVHHRVRNSLQLVRTMLDLQSRGASAETRAQLEGAAGRIMSIAAVHQRLYEGGSVAEGDAVLYLQGLLGDMQAMVDEYGESRTIELEMSPMRLPGDNLTPLGLIVTELVTNSVKYGAGRVLVRVERTETGLLIVVEDEGAGFSPAQPGRGGLGMRLVTALAKGDTSKSVRIDNSIPHGRIAVTMTF